MGRYSRHVKLAEIGREGQARIEAARVVVGSGPSGEVARRYLEAAGALEVLVGDDHIQDARFDDLAPAARDMALGAHAAAMLLVKIAR